MPIVWKCYKEVLNDNEVYVDLGQVQVVARHESGRGSRLTLAGGATVAVRREPEAAMQDIGTLQISFSMPEREE